MTFLHFFGSKRAVIVIHVMFIAPSNGGGATQGQVTLINPYYCCFIHMLIVQTRMPKFRSK
jgi:hypothetical protein